MDFGKLPLIKNSDFHSIFAQPILYTRLTLYTATFCNRLLEIFDCKSLRYHEKPVDRLYVPLMKAKV